MAKYRKLPVAIEAEQFDPEKRPWPAGVTEYAFSSPGKHYIQTLEGMSDVRPGDWIITGVAGERYPCRDDIFRATYEPAEEESHA